MSVKKDLQWYKEWEKKKGYDKLYTSRDFEMKQMFGDIKSYCMSIGPMSNISDELLRKLDK
tara:strand:+ start:1934 stop:2116 length:183 start_codon:yes stop_codon:yes gene_type:complete